MKTEVLAKLEKVLLDFMDSDEVLGEYYFMASEERMLAKVVADIMDAIDSAYELGLDEDEPSQ